MACINAFASSNSTPQALITEGNSLRKTVAATVKNQPVLYTGELSGTVASYSLTGEKLWQNQTDNKAVLFEINAADIDGDNNDDLLAASADGNIYAWGSNGVLLWQYRPENKVRFNALTVTKVADELRIYAGGNDQYLYELNANGQFISKTKFDGTIRTIKAGNFLSKNQSSLFIHTYGHDKYKWQFMGFIDPVSKNVLTQVSTQDKKVKALVKNFMVTDMDVADLNQDGLDDILFFGGGKAAGNSTGSFSAFDGQFNPLANYTISGKDKQRYAHIYGASLLPVRNEVMFQFGGIRYLVDHKGKLIQTLGEKYKGLIYNDFTLVPAAKKLFAAGQIGGGNTLYSFDLTDKNWLATEHKLTGRLADVEQNIETLYQQALKFEIPSYQQKSEKPWVMITSALPNAQVQKLDGAELKIVKQTNWKENMDRRDMVAKIGKVALKKDKRGKYDLSRKQIIAMAKDFEKNNQPFVVWAGHVTDPFYMHIDTLEAILEVAPNTAYGFIYAEMYNPKDPRVVYFIDEYVPRLAKAMRKHGKAKMYFRYKNVFWAASSHQQPWKDMFFSGEYADVLVPSSEDTSSRTQDINLTGRIGMFAGGFVDDFAMRLVDDNPTSWRPFSPGGQRSISPYLRQGTMMAAYGARMGILFNSQYTDQPGVNILYALMKSGVLPIVEKEDIQSISSWMLTEDINEDLVHSIDDHHKLTNYQSDDDNALMSVAQMHWAGTNLPEHDYSKAALGGDYRWLNYIPELPNGMVPIAPSEAHKQLQKAQVPYFLTDGKHGVVAGKKVAANTFKKHMDNTLSQGVKKLPIVVEGAAWSVIKLDENHSRIVLIDQGYVEPQDRNVTIRFQNRHAKTAVDILSKQALNIEKQQLKLTVPAGSMRFIDIAY